MHRLEKPIPPELNQQLKYEEAKSHKTRESAWDREYLEECVRYGYLWMVIKIQANIQPNKWFLKRCFKRDGKLMAAGPTKCFNAWSQFDTPIELGDMIFRDHAGDTSLIKQQKNSPGKNNIININEYVS